MTTTKNESIGERIRDARLKKSLRQKDLANILNVAEVTVKKYEDKSRKLHIDTVTKIANALEVSPNWLMFGLTNEQKNKRDELDLVMNTSKFLRSLGYTLDFSGGEECDLALIINGAEYTQNDMDILLDMIKACIDNFNKLKRGYINGKDNI
ncbi:MAG: helix-turn-helix domain-containing protein [Clostridium sp.]|uniref:helix-turn-helix domain-containing protein n=1 Tax=Clostridium sp. TaxID=1506 RepID=UPI0025BAE9A1|nr:helix-turn-helix domain-containing protein [Clostridium sp.]MCE5222076.1 helix-turn-helix domain-containing protein [Clostridium sp.]